MDIEIPYNVKEREDTGLYNSKLGIWLVFGCEISFRLCMINCLNHFS